MAIRAAAAAVPFGLLETIACVDGTAPLLELHQRRLETSWPAFFGGRAPDLARATRATIDESRGARVLVRVACLGRRGGKAKLDVQARPLPPVPRHVSVAIAAAPRGESAAQRRHKSADRAWVEELAVDGAFETLVWDDERGLLEGTRTNLFVVAGRELATPPVEFGLVPGVVRARVRRVAAKLGLEVNERKLAPVDLRSGGLLLTGSGVGIVAVAECDGRRIASRSASELAEQLRATAFPGG